MYHILTLVQDTYQPIHSKSTNEVSIAIHIFMYFSNKVYHAAYYLFQSSGAAKVMMADKAVKYVAKKSI